MKDKTFIIINGEVAKIVNLPTLEDAKHRAINVCDHSKEIIVRELHYVYNYAKVIGMGITEL